MGPTTYPPAGGTENKKTPKLGGGLRTQCLTRPHIPWAGRTKKHGKRSRAPAPRTKSRQYEGHDPLARAGSANKKQTETGGGYEMDPNEQTKNKRNWGVRPTTPPLLMTLFRTRGGGNDDRKGQGKG